MAQNRLPTVAPEGTRAQALLPQSTDRIAMGETSGPRSNESMQESACIRTKAQGRISPKRVLVEVDDAVTGCLLRIPGFDQVVGGLIGTRFSF